MRESKECLSCGGIFFRGETIKASEWGRRKYCSVGCGSRAALGKARATLAAKAAGRAMEGSLSGITPSGQEVELVEAEDEVVVVSPVSQAPGIERELKVVRVGPNPRMVMCEYRELASRRTCVVRVGDNRKWMRGMKFKMKEPLEEEAFKRPWEYVGVKPRRRGRW